MCKLRAGVTIIDKDYQMILIQSEVNETWVLHYYFGLILGIICLLISLAWWIHM